MRIVEEDTFGRIRRLIEGKPATGGPNKLKKGEKLSAAYLDEAWSVTIGLIFVWQMKMLHAN